MTTPFDTAVRTRAPFAPCWAGDAIGVPVTVAVSNAAAKDSHQGRLMINVWPLSPEGWLTG